MKNFLKAYALLYALMTVVTYGAMSELHPTLFDILDLPITIIAVVGLLSYAFDYGIAHRAFWRFYFYFAVAWDVLFAFVIFWHFRLGGNMAKEPQEIGSIAFGFLLALPEYYALYRLRYMDETEAAEPVS